MSIQVMDSVCSGAVGEEWVRSINVWDEADDFVLPWDPHASKTQPQVIDT